MEEKYILEKDTIAFSKACNDIKDKYKYLLTDMSTLGDPDKISSVIVNLIEQFINAYNNTLDLLKNDKEEVTTYELAYFVNKMNIILKGIIEVLELEAKVLSFGIIILDSDKLYAKIIAAINKYKVE